MIRHRDRIRHRVILFFMISLLENYSYPVASFVIIENAVGKSQP